MPHTDEKERFLGNYIRCETDSFQRGLPPEVACVKSEMTESCRVRVGLANLGILMTGTTAQIRDEKLPVLCKTWRWNRNPQARAKTEVIDILAPV